MIKEEIIQRADEYLQKLSEPGLKKYITEISQNQEFVTVYVQTMGDVFEDAEEHYDKFLYFFLLIHRSYTNRFRFFPKITMEDITKVEDENEKFFKEMFDKPEEVFEVEMEEYLTKHPQKVMIDFITLDLFESNEEAYDNINLELDNQIFFLLISIINIYENSLIESQKAFPQKQ